MDFLIFYKSVFTSSVELSALVHQHSLPLQCIAAGWITLPWVRGTIHSCGTADTDCSSFCKLTTPYRERFFWPFYITQAPAVPSSPCWSMKGSFPANCISCPIIFLVKHAHIHSCYPCDCLELWQKSHPNSVQSETFPIRSPLPWELGQLW